MEVVALGTILSTTIYLLIILWIIRQWDKTASVLPSHNINDVVVIIPVRNEEKTLKECLESALLQSSKAKICVVNDHSEDHTTAILDQYDNRIKRAELDEDRYGKKAAISHGISITKENMLAFTDGDCVLGPEYLSCIKSVLEKNDYTTGPIATEYTDGLLSAFQYIDFATLNLITAAGIKSQKYFISNGANSGIKRNMYDQLGGMKSHKNISSGDDIFLINAVHSQGGKIKYCKNTDAIVVTQEEESWGGLMSQRKRWATKTKYYAGNGLTYLQAVVFLCNFSITLSLFLGLFFPEQIGIIGMGCLLAKMAIDYYFVRLACNFVGNLRPLFYFIPNFFLYIAYMFYMAFHAILPSPYRWKGRPISK